MAKCYQGSPVLRQFVGARNDMLAMRAVRNNTNASSIFYTGPCPDADPNDQTNMDNGQCNGICGNICSGICGGCGSWENCACHGAPVPAVYAFYASACRLYANAGAPLPLGDTVYSVGPIDLAGGTVTIGQEGRYLAVWTLTGTAQANISGALALWKNGAAVGGAVDVVAMQGDALALVGQTAFTAQAGDTLQLMSTGALAVSGMPAATLTLVRIA